MMKLGVVLGSTRPGRKGEVVARWVYEGAKLRTDTDFEVVWVDIQTFALPLLDEPNPPAQGRYEHEHTRAWAAQIAELDAFIFVTPEYNHGPSAALKNALDCVYQEWNNKAAGFVSYGFGSGGTRAVEQLRQVMAELQIADVRAQVAFSLITDFAAEMTTLKPLPRHDKQLNTLLDQVIAWGKALQTLRN